MKKFAHTLFVALAAFTSGCAKTPELPALPGNPNNSIETIVVGNEFTISDARNIFTALNKKGRLNSLKNWITAPDEDLVVWSDFFNEYFYQEALQSNGLLELVEKRIERKGFLTLKNLSFDWIQSRSYKLENAALFSVLNYARFPTLVKQNAGYLTPELYNFLSRTHVEGENNYNEFGRWIPKEAIDPALGANDIVTFFQSPENVAALSKLSSRLKGSNFVENALFTLRDQRVKYQSAAPFEGFAYGLGRNLETKETQKLFELFALLNQSSNGIFRLAHQTLEQSPALGRILAKRLDPTISRAAGYFINKKLQTMPPSFWKGVVRKDSSSPPTKEFATLFSIIGSGLENLTSQGSGASLLEKTPIYLASLVVTEHIEAALRINPARTEYNLPSTSMNLLETQESGKPPQLNLQLSRDLEAMEGMKPFRDVLGTLVVQESFGTTLYNFDALQKSSLENLLQSALLSVQSTHRFADAAGLLMPVLRSAVLSTPVALTIEKLESPNMLDSLHRFLGGLSLETWNYLDHFLFNILQIGRLSDEDKQLVLQLWASDEILMDRVTALLESIEFLHTFNQPIEKNLPTVLGLCHGFLSNLRPKVEELRSLSSLMGFISDVDFIHFPYVYKNLEAGAPLAKLLFQLSFLTEEEGTLFSTTLNQSLSSELMRFGSEMSRHSPREMLTLATLLLRNGRTLLPDLETLHPSERIFLVRFLNSKDFDALWRFFHRYSSKENVRELIKDLRGLLTDGGLLDAAELLAKIQNPLLRRFARVIEKMIHSGEFEALLKALENIVPDSR